MESSSVLDFLSFFKLTYCLKYVHTRVHARLMISIFYQYHWNCLTIAIHSLDIYVRCLNLGLGDLWSWRFKFHSRPWQIGRFWAKVWLRQILSIKEEKICYLRLPNIKLIYWFYFNLVPDIFDVICRIYILECWCWYW